ncbi:MAG: hypothetical protein G8D59_07970 [gamma proteobacterium symbiont of Phacoides pectinatus]
MSQNLSRGSDTLALPHWLLHRYWVIPHLYEQQWEMYRNKSRRCGDRIVSISQPHVRPIVRGQLNKPVEFGSKLSVSLTGEGLAQVDHLRWDAFHEGLDLKSQVQECRYLVKDFGTSQSPKSTRQRDSRYCPDRPALITTPSRTLQQSCSCATPS